MSPESFVRGTRAALPPIALQIFRQAEHTDGAASAKLRNHFRYEEDGFVQPPFYVLRDPQVLDNLFKGSIDKRLLNDLTTLTKRPLVVRTSAVGGTLLPRSDVLRSAEEATGWLTGPFAEDIKRRRVSPDGLMLIAHHFIPALAAAFSTGSPEKREVYIEALWGIPEGLYYYPCDAYLVDTLSPAAAKIRPLAKDNYQVWETRRFKGEFVAPNDAGRFMVCTTLRPWDWRSTISRGSVVRDIAYYTRKTAAREAKRIKMMWLLGCAPWAGLPSTLPWFHDDEAEDWTTAGDEYQRNARDETVTLRTGEDLRALEERAAGGQGEAGSRLVVHVNPVENVMIRDEAVAERIGRASAQLGAVVELQGGILSHVYYTLKRTGASVAIRYPPRVAVPPALLNKLVRDKIPSVVAAGGESAKISHLAPEELTTALKIKLVEEAFEARDATAKDLIQEIADVLEVIDALIDISRISRAELKRVRERKRSQRGGFDKGVILLETSLSLGERREAPIGNWMHHPDEGAGGGVVDTNQPVPLETAKAGPCDVRIGADFVEFVQNATVGLTHPEWRVMSPQKIRVEAQTSAESVEWTLEGKREGGQVKLRLKIRVGTRQLTLPFDLGGEEGQKENS